MNGNGDDYDDIDGDGGVIMMMAWTCKKTTKQIIDKVCCVQV
jgi:hypothetical protein